MSRETARTPPVEVEDLRDVLSRVERPRRAGPLSASVTPGWRALLKIKHVPFLLFDVTAFPLMMTLLFTFLFGGALAGSPDAYVQFLLPGILVQAIVFITVYTGFGLNTDIDEGLFDRFRSLPIWQPAPLVGALLGDALRYSIAAVMVIGLGVVLGFRPEAGLVGVLLALALVLVFAFSLSWIWIHVGLLVEKPESVMTTSFLLLFPLTFVSNIFVDPETMPEWLQTVVALNPVTRLVDATRGFMHGGRPGRRRVGARRLPRGRGRVRPAVAPHVPPRTVIRRAETTGKCGRRGAVVPATVANSVLALAESASICRLWGGRRVSFRTGRQSN